MLSPAAFAGALAAPRDGAVSQTKSPGGDAAFGAVLFARLSAKAASGAGPAAVSQDAAPTIAGGGTATERDVEAEIAKLLKDGKSESEILDTLAAKLATSAGETLGLPAADARAQLGALFRSALAPLQGSSGESLASDRARLLAQRFVRIKEPATLIAGQIKGQQNRIAGNLLDAKSAKDIPALTQTNDSNATQPNAAAAGDSPDVRAKRALTAKITSLLEAGLSQAQIVATLLAQGDVALKATLPAASGDPASPPHSAANGDIAAAPGISPLGTRMLPLEAGVSALAIGARAAGARAAGASDGNGRTGDATPRLGSEPPIFVPGFVAQTPSGSSGHHRAVVPTIASTAVAAGAALSTSLHASESGDGRRVRFAGVSVAGGGDTVLGRVLSRAAGAAAARDSATSASAAESVQTPAAVASFVRSVAAAFAARTSPPAAALSDSSTVAASPDGAIPLSALRATTSPRSNSAPSASSSVSLTDNAGITTSAASEFGALGLPLSAADSESAGQATPADEASANSTAAAATADSANTLDTAITGDGTIGGPTSGAGGTANNPEALALAAFVKSFAAALGNDASSRQAAIPLESRSQLTPVARGSKVAADAGAFSAAVAPLITDRANSAVAADPIRAAPAVDHSAIVEQVLRGAFMRNVGQSSEIRLTLLPEGLGDVNVKLVVSAGIVSAHVVAQTPEVRDALVAAQPQLTKSLADAGLKLDSFNVDLSGSGFTGFSQQNDRSPGEQRSSRSAHSDDRGVDDALLEAVPSFGPSTASKPTAADHNYLV